MIRKATPDDITSVAMLYSKAIDYENSHVKYTSWQKGVYPTAETARLGVKDNSLYVYEENGRLLASVILDTIQPPEYRKVSWRAEANLNEALVIHTLCVDPEYAGYGIGTSIVDFAKELASKIGCVAIRLNTSARNINARHLYEKSGFEVVATQRILLNGQIHCGEHQFMEYVMKKAP